jgi:hypothetical protein
LSDKNYTRIARLISGSRPSLLEAIQCIALRYGLALCPPLQKPMQADAIRAVAARALGLRATPCLGLDGAGQPASAVRICGVNNRHLSPRPGVLAIGPYRAGAVLSKLLRDFKVHRIVIEHVS